MIGEKIVLREDPDLEEEIDGGEVTLTCTAEGLRVGARTTPWDKEFGVVHAGVCDVGIRSLRELSRTLQEQPPNWKWESNRPTPAVPSSGNNSLVLEKSSREPLLYVWLADNIENCCILQIYVPLAPLVEFIGRVAGYLHEQGSAATPSDAPAPFGPIYRVMVHDAVIDIVRGAMTEDEAKRMVQSKYQHFSLDQMRVTELPS